jgi:hypothetical protein
MWARNELWLVLEVADGGGLGDYMGALGRGLTEDEARAIMYNLMTALTACHAARIIHRDVKADNILIVNGVAKLADFGISYAHSQAVGLRRRPKSFRGSAYWMSPEVAVLSDPKLVDQTYTATVDCWSAGCTLIELMEGEPPLYSHEPMDAVAAFAAMADGEGDVPVLQEGTAVSDEARAFQEACCTVSASKRPSAQELLTYDWLTGAPDEHGRQAIVTTLATAYKVARNVAEPDSASPVGTSTAEGPKEPGVDAPSTADAPVRMDSWLVKQGKQRFFVQLGHMLYWFSDVPTGVRDHENLARQAANSLDLRLYRVAVSRASASRAAVSVILQPVSTETSAKTYILDADRRELGERWVASMAAGSPESVPLRHEMSEASLEAVQAMATRRVTTKAAEAARRTGAQVSAVPSTASHEGWLDKLGGRGKWQARYFRLANEKLSWHTSEAPGASVKNSISLLKDRVVLHAPTTPELRRARQRKARVTFALEGLNKTYLLSGEGSVVTRWIEHLGRNAEVLHVGAEAVEYLAAGDFEAAERASRAALSAASVTVSGVVGDVEKMSKDDILASFGVASPEELMNKMGSEPSITTTPPEPSTRRRTPIRSRSRSARDLLDAEVKRFRTSWLTLAGRREFVVLDRKRRVVHRFAQDPRSAAGVGNSGRATTLWSAVRSGGDLGIVDLWDYGPAVLQRGERASFLLPSLSNPGAAAGGGGGTSGSRLLGMSDRRGDPRRGKPTLLFTAETADDATAWLMDLAKLSFSGGAGNSGSSLRNDSGGGGMSPPSSKDRTIRSPRDALAEMRQFQSSLDVLAIPEGQGDNRGRNNKLRVRSSEGRDKKSAGSAIVRRPAAGSHIELEPAQPLERSVSTAVVPNSSKKKSAVTRSAAAAAAAAPMKRTKSSRRKKRAKDPVADF